MVRWKRRHGFFARGGGRHEAEPENLTCLACERFEPFGEVGCELSPCEPMREVPDFSEGLHIFFLDITVVCELMRLAWLG